MVETKKKSIWKRWWMIIFYCFVGLMIIGMFMEGNSGPTTIDEVNSNPESKVTTSNYVIDITGTDGLEFSGSIGGGTNSRTIDGSIPATYEVSDWPAVAVIQKKDAYGTLTVTITKKGKVLNTQTTTADYGAVSVSS